MRVATYNRKSVYSDHSDSVANQERMCRDYAEMRFGGSIETFAVYQDEGFTGANTERPGLKRLLSDIDVGKIDVLVVYQLDRISRSVKDFSEIWDRLEKNGVAFMSLKENMDTDTPMGRAMIYISMVFAQMERETIAERVADNARGLAMKGLWTCGAPPTGYKVEPVLVDGRKHYKLAIDEGTAEYVREIYRDFLETGKATQALATMYSRTGKTGVAGGPLRQSQIWLLLSRPTYCAATPEVYDFWKARGCIMAGPGRESWDGSRGVMAYGRMRKQSGKVNGYKDWIISLGLHEPIISADDWLAVQRAMAANEYCKDGKNPPTLLKGVVRCARCGCLLSVRRNGRRYGNYSYYGCEKRVYMGPKACDLPYVPTESLDDAVMDLLRKAIVDEEVLESFYGPQASEDEDDGALGKAIKAAERRLENLMKALVEAEGSGARKYIIQELDAVDAELCRLKEKEDAIRRQKEADIRNKLNRERDKLTIENFIDNFEGMSAEEKNLIMKELIKKCMWDGEKLTVSMSDQP